MYGGFVAKVKKLRAPHQVDFLLRTKQAQSADDNGSPLSHTYSVPGVEEYVKILGGVYKEERRCESSTTGSVGNNLCLIRTINTYGGIKPNPCLSHCIFCKEVMEFGDLEPGMVHDKEGEEEVRDNRFKLRTLKRYYIQCMAIPDNVKDLEYDDSNPLMNNLGKDVMLWPFTTKKGKGKVFQVGQRTAEIHYTP